MPIGGALFNSVVPTYSVYIIVSDCILFITLHHSKCCIMIIMRLYVRLRMRARVRARVRACARVRMHLCLCVRERTRACVGAHACALEGAGVPAGVGARTYVCNKRQVKTLQSYTSCSDKISTIIANGLLFTPCVKLKDTFKCGLHRTTINCAVSLLFSSL